MKTGLKVITFALSLLTASWASAHDIWLFPERFRLAKGDTLIVRQLVGPELSTEVLETDVVLELPVLRDMTPRFELVTPNGSVDLLSELPDMRTRPEVKPVLNRKLDFEGLAVVTMEHDFIYTAHSPEVFLTYLKHEEFKLEKFQHHIGFRPYQRERYARALKTLVQVGRIRKAGIVRDKSRRRLSRIHRRGTGFLLSQPTIFIGRMNKKGLVPVPNCSLKGNARCLTK